VVVDEWIRIILGIFLILGGIVNLTWPDMWVRTFRSYFDENRRWAPEYLSDEKIQRVIARMAGIAFLLFGATAIIMDVVA
jgi:hypothetical protein